MLMLRLLVVLSFLLAAPSGAQIQRVTGPDESPGNHFGAAVAFDGDRLLIGEPGASGCAANAGAAYVYERTPDGRYRQAATLAPDGCEAERFFGRAVALEGDIALIAGSQPFLGATRANPVTVFERDPDGSWGVTARLFPASEDAALGFGSSIDLDAGRAVVAAEGDPISGRPGSVFIYERMRSGTWRLSARIAAPGRFGASADLDGERLAVTAPAEEEGKEGALYLYERDAEGRWQSVAVLDGFREAMLRCDLDGERLLVGRSRYGSRQQGRAEVYEPDGDGAWQRTAVIEPISSYDFGGVGATVALSGDRALVAGYTEQINLPVNIDRVVYVFRHDGREWVQQTVIDVGSTAFGVALDLEGRTALIGESGDDEPGAAYVVQLF